jgi:predicted ribosomally synthesized peptide with nif11-like leader
MSEQAAVAFLQRLEDDEDLATELSSLKEDPAAVIEKVRAAGFDVEPDEIREAFLDRYGAELTPEQLDRIAAGVDEAGVITSYVLVGMMGAAAAAAL